MSVIDRLIGTEEPKIPVHQFWAGFQELYEGAITFTEFTAAFIISAEEEAEMLALKGLVDASADPYNFLQHVHSLFVLAEVSLLGYEVRATLLARVNQLP